MSEAKQTVEELNTEVEEKEEETTERPMPVIQDIENADDVKDVLYRKTFSFSYTFDKGTANERTEKGTFVCKRFNIADTGAVGVEFARLNHGQQGLDRFTSFIHEMLSFCSFALVSTPKWWNPEEFFEEEPLRGVYNHIRKWHESFR